MASKQTRSVRKLKPKHRAVKPRPVRPLDVAKPDNHAARHEAKKAKRAAHEALMRKQAEDKAARLLEEAHVAALAEDVLHDLAKDLGVRLVEYEAAAVAVEEADARLAAELGTETPLEPMPAPEA